MCLFIAEVVRAASFITACMFYKVGISETQMEAIRGAITGSTQVSLQEEFPKTLFLFLMLPDFLVLIAFIFLVWQLLSLYDQGHANLFKLVCTGRGKYIILGICLILSCLQILMLALYLAGPISGVAFSIECTVLNLLVATLAWIILLVYMLKFSGSPFRAQAYKVKMKKLTYAIIVWVITRYFRGITTALENRFQSFVLDSLTKSKNDSLAIPLLCILSFVIEEIIPMLMVLDWTFMEIFVMCPNMYRND